MGHSTRSAAEFVAILQSHGIEVLADVRRFPGSRRLPQFARQRLHADLARAGMEYRWIPGLGGRRVPRRDSRNTAWRVSGFRGYADYMETADFRDSFDALIATARERRTAIMCAEVLWWRCHRRLIADAALVRGGEVLHIATARDASPHRLAPPARLVGSKLSYVAEAPRIV